MLWNSPSFSFLEIANIKHQFEICRIMNRTTKFQPIWKDVSCSRKFCQSVWQEGKAFFKEFLSPADPDPDPAPDSNPAAHLKKVSGIHTLLRSIIVRYLGKKLYTLQLYLVEILYTLQLYQVQCTWWTTFLKRYFLLLRNTMRLQESGINCRKKKLVLPMESSERSNGQKTCTQNWKKLQINLAILIRYVM